MRVRNPMKRARPCRAAGSEAAFVAPTRRSPAPRSSGQRIRRLITATLLLFAAGCSANIEGSGNAASAGTTANGSGGGSNPAQGGQTSTITGGATSSLDCATPSPGSAPLRRLSNAEYRNSVNDLFQGVSGFDSVVADATKEFPAEAESLGFRNSAQFLTVQSLNAQKYMDAAETIAAKAAANDGVVGCTPVDGSEMDCAKQFIQSFGKRAYRRPLTSDESARYETQFQTALQQYGFSTGVEWTVFAMLQSPSFLYRVEHGEAATAAATRPTSLEMASRLSYLFWQSAPDAALLKAAESGELETPVQIEQKARQMLADPRSARLFEYFAEWLDLDRLDDFSRDTSVFPNLPSDLPKLYQSETQAFVSALLTRPDGNLNELLTAPYTYANKTLASFYGLSGPTTSAFERVSDPRRSGVLTQAFLAAQDKPYRTSIVRRGLKVRTDLLCQTIPAPPNNVPLDLDSVGSDLSQRERLAQHRADPSCAGCHTLLDPVGLVFESFDAVGRFRTVDESGATIDTHSELTATSDADGPIADVRELGARLAGSQQARDCYVTQTFRFFFGRDVESADACSLSRLKQSFENENFSLSELLVALTQTDAFLYRPTQEAP